MSQMKKRADQLLFRDLLMSSRRALPLTPPLTPRRDGCTHVACMSVGPAWRSNAHAGWQHKAANLGLLKRSAHFHNSGATLCENAPVQRAFPTTVAQADGYDVDVGPHNAYCRCPGGWRPSKFESPTHQSEWKHPAAPMHEEMASELLLPVGCG